MTKSQIRSNLKEQRNKLSEEEQLEYGRQILERLLQTEIYCNSSRMFTFVSFQSEVDTHEIIRVSLLSGKKVYVPRVEPQGMEFYEIDSLEGLVESKYKILEPIAEEAYRYKFYDSIKGEAEAITAEPMKGITEVVTAEPMKGETAAVTAEPINEAENLMLLPGLAFDLQGNRIGYGAGYYDRYLSGHESSHFLKLALAYDFQIMDHLPAEEFDIKVDYILTPSRLIVCGKQS